MSNQIKMSAFDRSGLPFIFQKNGAGQLKNILLKSLDVKELPTNYVWIGNALV